MANCNQLPLQPDDNLGACVPQHDSVASCCHTMMVSLILPNLSDSRDNSVLCSAIQQRVYESTLVGQAYTGSWNPEGKQQCPYHSQSGRAKAHIQCGSILLTTPSPFLPPSWINKMWLCLLEAFIILGKLSSGDASFSREEPLGLLSVSFSILFVIQWLRA